VTRIKAHSREELLDRLKWAQDAHHALHVTITPTKCTICYLDGNHKMCVCSYDPSEEGIDAERTDSGGKGR
jgi:hypothetical protein